MKMNNQFYPKFLLMVDRQHDAYRHYSRCQGKIQYKFIKSITNIKKKQNKIIIIILEMSSEETMATSFLPWTSIKVNFNFEHRPGSHFH